MFDDPQPNESFYTQHLMLNMTPGQINDNTGEQKNFIISQDPLGAGVS